MPSALIPSLKTFLLACLLGVIVQIGSNYPLIYARTDAFFVNTTVFYRLGYMWLAATLQRTPYYFAWVMSEGSCILCGIGYNEDKNGNPTWFEQIQISFMCSLFTFSIIGIVQPM